MPSFVSYYSYHFKIYSDIRIAFFVFPSAWNIFFHPFAFNWYVFLDLTLTVSCRQHIHVTLFLLHLATLCLLSGAFNQFTFKVTSEMYVVIAILLVVFWLFCSSLSFPLVLFPDDLMTFHSFLFIFCVSLMGFPGGASGKEPICPCRRYKKCGFDPWVGKSSGGRARQSTPVSLPRESHGQRSLVGYSPWGHKDLDINWSDWACI